jgi:hypothetical protein
MLRTLTRSHTQLPRRHTTHNENTKRIMSRVLHPTTHPLLLKMLTICFIPCHADCTYDLWGLFRCGRKLHYALRSPLKFYDSVFLNVAISKLHST